MFSICATTVAINHKNIAKDPQRISKSKSFVNQYNRKEINLSPHKNDWKKFEWNNKSNNK